MLHSSAPEKWKPRTQISIFWTTEFLATNKPLISSTPDILVWGCLLWLSNTEVLYFLWFSLETPGTLSYQFWSWSSPLWSGPPMQAICCLRFQSCSSSMSMLFISKSVSFTIWVILLRASWKQDDYWRQLLKKRSSSLTSKTTESGW